MAYPKIQYVDGSAAAQTVQFALPPTQKPFASREATRHDAFASSGLHQSTFERTDEYFEINMQWVTLGTDVEAWDAFMTLAIEGIEFEYFPDADVDVSYTCTLEDTTWKPERKFFQRYGFKARFRKEVLP